ncbi:unnamed protein product [Notodromas monacha]|uniref:STAS domain-containing protein n=1 Tax=Notodromas monacha TaxID=399045 RepID=A0A7R9G9K1_9CRUS|nr:unnamed protein product [Notodromas monacha]CAG0914346.1 unnamed protein product [Notodromas monacha]
MIQVSHESERENLYSPSMAAEFGSTGGSRESIDEDPGEGGLGIRRNCTKLSIQLERSPYTQHELCDSFDYRVKESTGYVERTRSAARHRLKRCAECRPKEALFARLPILKWLPNYEYRRDFVPDMIAGVTVAVMHIPQGMAYSMLAGMPAVNGLYMALFPVLTYILFCNSRHNSMGTFAVVMLMTGILADQLLAKHGEYSEETKTGYTHVQVATIIAFSVGFWQLLMSFLRLGTLSVLLSDVLISGFTTGAAVHVFTSQLTGLFGLRLSESQEFPKILRTHYNVVANLFESNVVAVIVSAATMGAMAINNEIIKPRLAKKCPVPVPIELIAVVSGTLLSYYMQLHEKYKLPIIETVPTGLPPAITPPLELMKEALSGSVIIAVVAYTTSYSLERMFAKHHNYESDPNQELFAQGMANVVGSFFSCAPVAASMSRSLVQQTVGGATQISNVVSCGILIFILLFMGSYVEPLPICILSSIIVVSLKGMFAQFGDLVVAWRSSKLDAFIWLATFVSVVGVDIDFGLAVGVCVSLVTLLWRNQRAYACTLGEIPNTGIYVDLQRYAAAEEIHNVKIFHYGAGLHFANRDYFREELVNLTGLDPVKWHEQALKKIKKEGRSLDRALKRAAEVAALEELKSQKKSRFWSCCLNKPPKDHNNHAINNKHSEISPSVSQEESQNGSSNKDSSIDMSKAGEHLAAAMSGVHLRKMSVHFDTNGNPLPFRHLVIDLSGVSFIDMSGVKLLRALLQDYEKINVQVLFAGPTEPVLHMFRKMAFTSDISTDYFFPTVNDAVVCSRFKIVGMKGRTICESKLTILAESDAANVV